MGSWAPLEVKEPQGFDEADEAQLLGKVLGLVTCAFEPVLHHL